MLNQHLSLLRRIPHLPPPHRPRRHLNLRPRLRLKRAPRHRPTRERSRNLRTRSSPFPSPTNPHRARRPLFQKARLGTTRARASARGSRPRPCVPMCSRGLRSSSARASRSSARWARGLHPPRRRRRRRRRTRMQRGCGDGRGSGSGSGGCPSISGRSSCPRVRRASSRPPREAVRVGWHTRW